MNIDWKPPNSHFRFHDGGLAPNTNKSPCKSTFLPVHRHPESIREIKWFSINSSMFGSQYPWLVKYNMREKILTTNILTALHVFPRSTLSGEKISKCCYFELCSTLTVIHHHTINMSLKHMGDYSVWQFY